MSTEANYAIASMSRSDLEMAMAWAAAEGWNPGLEDAESFYHTDPSGYFMGVLNGTPIASISAVKYGQTFGFIGFYIVKPEFRGRGYGFQLWQASLKTLQGRTIGLDGVLAQQPNYVKSGFRLAHRNIRYEGTARGDRQTPDDDRIVDLSSVEFDEIYAYDRAFFPDDRAEFLKRWLLQPRSYAVGAVENSQLLGYGVLRPCQVGVKIGPLLANSADIAGAILDRLLVRVGRGELFYLDVPEVNSDAVALAQSHRMHAVFETARMYARGLPTLSLERTFGIATFELG